MAVRVEEFPVAPRRAQRRSYPWDEWTDGSIWMLRQGEDYDAKTDQFRNRLYAVAHKRGLEVRTTKGTAEDGVDTLTIQFIAANGAANGHAPVEPEPVY